jgi:hypothetical protein
MARELTYDLRERWRAWRNRVRCPKRVLPYVHRRLIWRQCLHLADRVTMTVTRFAWPKHPELTREV